MPIRNRNRRYTNGEITIIWRATECTHSTLCYTRLRAVFDPLKRPWIMPSGATTEQILEIIELCPTLALTFFWNDDKRNQTEKSSKLFTGDVEQLLAPVTQVKTENAATINIRSNGPVVVSGEFSVIDGDGKELPKMRMMSLCRCGLSGNMPHCDGAHFKAGFKVD